MYNRYLPQDEAYLPVEPTPPEGESEHTPEPHPSQSEPLGKKLRLPKLSEGKEGLSSLLKAMKLDNIDSGDLLLLLIILFLLVEGDDLELVIALGLVLLMGTDG